MTVLGDNFSSQYPGECKTINLLDQSLDWF